MTASNLFHVGILVPDIDEAIARFAEVLGLEFKEPAVAHVDRFEYGSTVEALDLRITWSIQGPPYLELLESQDNSSLYGHAHEGLHHVGLWEPDPEALVQRLHTLGLHREATQYTPDDHILATYSAPAGLYGTRLEFIEASRRPGMEAWLAGGDWHD
jgi:catechol 2,3-dioxygenase-like lactoylglutathione lyase family enzyme